jgi:hypothetical protein
LHAIQHDPQIQLAFDGQRFFDEQALDHTTFRTGLMGDQRHAQNFFGKFCRLGGIARDLDAAAFAAPAGVNLCLHDHAPADLLRRRRGFIGRERDLAARNGDLVLGQDRLGLILMNFHGVCLC